MTMSGGTRADAPPGRASASGSVARSSATVAAWTLVSRATGLLRVVVIGAVLGPTFLANTFLATNNVPNLMYGVVAGPVLALVVVPAIVRTLLERGEAASVLHVRRLSGLLVIASGAVALLLMPISLVLGWALTLGVPAADQGRARLIAVVLLLVVAPQVVLYTVAALGAAAQQARERYALAAAAPALENVGLMLTMAAVAVVYRPGTDVAEAPFGMVLLLGLGATASVALHAGVQMFGARRVGFSLRPASGWRQDAEVRAVAVRLRRSVPVAVLPAGGFFLLLAFAATMPGGVLLFQIAFTVYGVPVALGARAVTTAVLPGMSTAAQAGDRLRFAGAWRQAFGYATVAGLPALCVIVVFAGTIAGTLAAGQLSTDAAVLSLAVCIAILGVAQLANGVHEVGRQALFARLDSRGPQVAGMVTFAVTAVGGAVTLLLPAGLPRLAGLAVALLLADVAGAATVVRLVQRVLHPERGIDLRRTGATVLAAVAMLPVLIGGWLLTGSGGRVHDLGVMVVSAALAVAVFALALTAFTGRRGAWT
jgi:putative peptidoglycan lipid II flippase